MEKQKKPITTWELHNDNGKGCFKFKVKDERKGTKLISGTTSDGKMYSYNAYLTNVVDGKLVWIDVSKTDFGINFKVILQNDKGLKIITMPSDASYLNDVVSRLSTLGKELHTTELPFSFSMQEVKDAKGNTVMTNKGNVKYKRTIFIGKLKCLYNAENPKPKELEWKQTLGKWDTSKEQMFWIEKIKGMQKFLLDKKVAIPYAYNSALCTNATNFKDEIGVEALDSKLVEIANELYKEKSKEYYFLESKGGTSSTSADDILDYYNEQFDSNIDKNTVNDFKGNDFSSDDPFATDETPIGNNLNIDDDLPF